MEYLEIRFYCQPAMNEILIAWLSDAGFDMFEEAEDGLKAYIPSNLFSESSFNEALESIPGAKGLAAVRTFIPAKNWNSQWESNFEPVTIANKLHIRAPFHPSQNYETEIIIEPKMSFGTGHHSTTSMMSELMLDLSIEGKSVLDMGCGSGILAILAGKFKAKSVLAIDNDDWAIENCIENCQRNNVTEIETLKGEAYILQNKKFDIILANINRNVLLTDMKTYSDTLNVGGQLLLSGFFVEDHRIICEAAMDQGLQLQKELEKLNWKAIQFTKIA